MNWTITDMKRLRWVELTTWMLPTVLSIQLQDLRRCNAVVNEELFGIYMYQSQPLKTCRIYKINQPVSMSSYSSIIPLILWILAYHLQFISLDFEWHHDSSSPFRHSQSIICKHILCHAIAQLPLACSITTIEGASNQPLTNIYIYNSFWSIISW